MEDFLENFKDDPTVKIPRVYKQLSGSRVLVMEWIDGIRCTDPQVKPLYFRWMVLFESFITFKASTIIRYHLLKSFSQRTSGNKESWN